MEGFVNLYLKDLSLGLKIWHGSRFLAVSVEWNKSSVQMKMSQLCSMRVSRALSVSLGGLKVVIGTGFINLSPQSYAEKHLGKDIMRSSDR